MLIKIIYEYIEQKFQQQSFHFIENSAIHEIIPT